MRTQKLKLVLIAITAFVYFLLNFIPNSEAIRIVEMDPTHGTEVTSSGGVNYHTGYVRTTEGLGYVKWYVDNEYAGTYYVNYGETEAYFSPYWLGGSLQGVDYTITAVAYSLEDENEDGEPDTDSRSYELTVCESVVVPLVSNHTNTIGYIEITNLYYDSGSAVCDGNIVVYNLSSDETYDIVDWGGRLSCNATEEGQVLAPDAKKHEWGGTLGPGETFSETIALSMDLAIRGAVDGRRYSMNADYWISLSTGDDNEVDGVGASASDSLTYRPQ